MRISWVVRTSRTGEPRLPRQLEDLEAGALWTVAIKIEPWFPNHLGSHTLVLPPVARTRVAVLARDAQAGRRVIYLSNPNRRDVSAAVGWLHTGLQVMNPGEAASARHSASARFHRRRIRRYR